jgi:hypothetical protein
VTQLSWCGELEGAHLIAEVIFVNCGVASVVQAMQEVWRRLAIAPHKGTRGLGPVIRAGAGMPERQLPGPSLHGADGYVLLCAGREIALRFDSMLSAIVSTAVGATGCMTDETAVCKNSGQARP